MEFRVAATFTEAKVESEVCYNNGQVVRTVRKYLLKDAQQIIVRKLPSYKGIGLNHKPHIKD